MLVTGRKTDPHSLNQVSRGMPSDSRRLPPHSMSCLGACNMLRPGSPSKGYGRSCVGIHPSFMVPYPTRAWLRSLAGIKWCAQKKHQEAVGMTEDVQAHLVMKPRCPSFRSELLSQPAYEGIKTDRLHVII